MLLRSAQFAVLVVLSDIAFASIGNGTIKDVDNKLDVKAVNNKLDVEAINKKLDEGESNKKLETKKVKPERRRNTHRSTSSSSGSRRKSDEKSGDTGVSLDASTSSSSSSENRLHKKNMKPKSSAERRGWRKWHRKCTPCPEQSLRWRDQRIKWICGAYQRARRTFKSMCMMHYRNCQDGTMFTKIHDHRCPNDISKDDKPHGDHFFYDYKVHMTDESTSSDSDSTSSLESSETY